MQSGLRHDWRTDEIRAIHDQPLLALVFQAASVHRANQTPDEMQVCKLINIKTARARRIAATCSQSAHWQTGVEPQALMDKTVVVDIAKALQNGVSRVCMGAAWRDVRDGVQFDRVL
jgi:biotin synthase